MLDSWGMAIYRVGFGKLVMLSANLREASRKVAILFAAGANQFDGQLPTHLLRRYAK